MDERNFVRMNKKIKRKMIEFVGKREIKEKEKGIKRNKPLFLNKQGEIPTLFHLLAISSPNPPFLRFLVSMQPTPSFLGP